MDSELKRDLLAALERPHRLGTIGGDLEEQLVHCASFSSVLHQVLDHPDDEANQTEGKGIDLGTGGGLPGLALAALWPAMTWTLVDMRVARADEVERTALRLGFGDRVRVVGAEAQVLGHNGADREQYDVAVARAFGPASVTAECAAGVVAVGGHFVVSEPPQTAETQTEPRWDSEALHHLGFDPPQLLHSGDASFAVLRKVRSTPEAIPRLPARSTRGWYRPHL